MPTLVLSGSINPRPGTIHIIGTVQGVATYVLGLEIGQLRNQDELEIRVAAKPQIGTITLAYFGNYANEQTQQMVYSTPVVTSVLQPSVKQTSGNNTRYFSFEIWSI